MRTWIETLRRPVPDDTRRALATAWARVPQRYRTSNQFLGRQYAGCGATIGAMPRCDFACRGCYLGTDANRTPALAVSEIEAQLRQIREWLGEGGNLQLTDGEVALRPADELVHLVRYARQIGLVPMLMTHGDGIRRDPALLERLVREGGLTELSIHVDTTQRGRRESAYRRAPREVDLMPLRDEFAALVRCVRRSTGRRLEAATTMTVTTENLAEIPEVIRWLLRNADAFKMISFQPVAQVGRTEAGLGGGVSAAELWQRIAVGLAGARSDSRPLDNHKGWLGHPDCSHFVQGLVRLGTDGEPRFHPLLDSSQPTEQDVIHGALDRVGSLTFRLDSCGRALARALGVGLAHAVFLSRHVLPLLLRWSRRVAPEGRFRFAWDLARGHARLHYLNIVSHHFMSPEEIATPEGRARLELCAFQVPIGDQMRSMCEVNALGIRDHFYALLRARQPGVRGCERSAE